MASVYEKRPGQYFVQYRDETGRRRNHATHARTKTEARRIALELELRAERLRLGLEAPPPVDGGGSLAALLTWWLETYSKGGPSHKRNVATVMANLLRSELAEVRLAHLTSGLIETFLQKRSTQVGPQTNNHLRRFILVAF